MDSLRGMIHATKTHGPWSVNTSSDQIRVRSGTDPGQIANSLYCIQPAAAAVQFCCYLFDHVKHVIHSQCDDTEIRRSTFHSEQRARIDISVIAVSPVSGQSISPVQCTVHSVQLTCMSFRMRFDRMQKSFRLHHAWLIVRCL